MEPTGGVWNSSSPSSMMADRAPSYIQGLVEERMHGQGLGLQELAIFAATLADLIRHEAVGDLESIYSSMQMPESARLPADAIDHVFKMYLMTYIKGPISKNRLPTTLGNGGR